MAAPVWVIMFVILWSSVCVRCLNDPTIKNNDKVILTSIKKDYFNHHDSDYPAQKLSWAESEDLLHMKQHFHRPERRGCFSKQWRGERVGVRQHLQQHPVQTAVRLKAPCADLQRRLVWNQKWAISNCSSDSRPLLPALREVECVFNSSVFSLLPPSFSWGGEGQCLSVCLCECCEVCLFMFVSVFTCEALLYTWGQKAQMISLLSGESYQSFSDLKMSKLSAETKLMQNWNELKWDKMFTTSFKNMLFIKPGMKKCKGSTFCFLSWRDEKINISLVCVCLLNTRLQPGAS